MDAMRGCFKEGKKKEKKKKTGTGCKDAEYIIEEISTLFYS